MKKIVLAIALLSMNQLLMCENIEQMMTRLVVELEHLKVRLPQPPLPQIESELLRMAKDFTGQKVTVSDNGLQQSLNAVIEIFMRGVKGVQAFEDNLNGFIAYIEKNKQQAYTEIPEPFLKAMGNNLTLRVWQKDLSKALEDLTSYEPTKTLSEKDKKAARDYLLAMSRFFEELYEFLNGLVHKKEYEEFVQRKTTWPDPALDNEIRPGSEWFDLYFMNFARENFKSYAMKEVDKNDLKAGLNAKVLIDALRAYNPKLSGDYFGGMFGDPW